MIGQADGCDGKNKTKVRKADRMAITKVIYRRWVHFLTSLNREELCSWVGLFFNEIEPFDNICSVFSFSFYAS